MYMYMKYKSECIAWVNFFKIYIRKQYLQN